jgi:hypothetical protein
MQGEVLEILNENSPKAYTAKELAEQIGINDNSVGIGLNKLVRFNLIQVRTREIIHSRFMKLAVGTEITYKLALKVKEYYCEHRTLDR